MIYMAEGVGYVGSHTNKILNKRDYETVIYYELNLWHHEFAK